MGKPYSLDLRERIVSYVLAGHSARAAARVFGVSPSTSVRLVREHRRCGSIAPKRQGRAPGTVGKLAPDMDFLIEVVQCERACRLPGINCHPQCINNQMSAHPAVFRPTDNAARE